MITVTKINSKLKRLYGLHPQLDVPKYRVIRSDEATEKRTGDYNLYTESGVFVRRERGTRLIKKYWYMPPCWVLERAEPNMGRQDIDHEKWTYEPIMNFLDKDNKNPMELSWRAVEFLVERFEYIENQLDKSNVKSESEWKEEEEKEIKAESERDFGIIDAPEPTKELPTFKTSSLLIDTGKKIEKNLKLTFDKQLGV